MLDIMDTKLGLVKGENLILNLILTTLFGISLLSRINLTWDAN